MARENKRFKELRDNIEYVKTIGAEEKELKDNNALLNSNLRKNFSFILSKSTYATVPSYLLRHSIPLVFLLLYQGGLSGAALYIQINQVFGDAKTIIEMFWAHGGYDTYCVSLKQLNRTFAVLEKDNFSSIAEITYLPVKKPSIIFQNISFSYPEINKKVLENISFNFQQGKKYAIVGPNGVGKSTLLKLIVKLYQPQQGVIKLDDIKLEKIDNSALRKKVLYLPNYPSFFNTSLGNNIVYPDTYQANIHKEKLETIAKKLGVKEFIDKLPNR